jgi:hypothetical protein
MAELMPRNPTESRPFGGWLQQIAQQLGLAQRFPAAVPEHHILWSRPSGAPTVCPERGNRVAAALSKGEGAAQGPRTDVMRTATPA